MNKKSILCIICITVFFALIKYAYASNIGVTAESVTADPGSTVSIKYITNGISSSNKLGAIEVSVGQLPEGISLQKLSSSLGTVTNNIISWFDSATEGYSSNVTVTLTLNIAKSVENGTYSIPVNFSALSDFEANDYGKTVNGVVNVISTPIETPNVPEETTKKDEEKNDDNQNKQEKNISKDASIKSLTAEANNKDLKVSLNANKYTTTVDSNVNEVAFTVVTTSDKAKIDSNVSTSGVGFVKNSESSGKKVYTMSNLKEGNNVIKIEIIAEDGTTANYTFAVTRKVGQSQNEVVPNIVDNTIEGNTSAEELENSELALKSLVITGAELSPQFNPDVYLYNAVLIEADAAEIIAISNDNEATVEINGHKNLVLGENLITILLTKDGVTKTYQVILNNEEFKPVIQANENGIAIGEASFRWKHIAIGALAVVAVTIIITIIVNLARRNTDEENNENKENSDKESNIDKKEKKKGKHTR